MSTTKKILIILGVIIFLLIIMVTCIASLAGPKKIKATTPVGIATEMLGEPEGETDNGIISVTYKDSVLNIEYRCFPLGLSSYEREAGSDLAPVYKKVFEKTDASEISTIILGLFEDKYGNYNWKHVMTLGLTRTSFNKINWDHISYHEFYSVCDDFWIKPGMSESEPGTPLPPLDITTNTTSKLTSKEQSYSAFIINQSEELVDILEAIAALEDKVINEEPGWKLDLAVQVEKLRQLCDEAADVTPPDSMSEIHTKYMQGMNYYNEAFTLVTQGINNSDDTLVIQAGEKMELGAEYRTEAIDMLIEFLESKNQ